MKDKNPMITSIASGTHEFLFLLSAKIANTKYRNACNGLKLFHHIFLPNVSGPDFLNPPK